MKIAVCDDEQYFVDNILERVREFDICDVSPNKFDGYTDPQDLLDNFNKERYDLVYLDIEMKDKNGLNIAHEIKKCKHNCMIIFVTGYDKYVHQSYRVEAFQYINKPIDDELFTFELRRAIKKYKRMNKFILFNTTSGSRYIKTSDIIYLETCYTNYQLFLIDGQVYEGSSKTVKEAKRDLIKYHFYQLSRSIIINFSYVDSYTTNSVTMMNEEVLSLSRLKRTEFRRTYRNFIDKENDL